jgi:hypothetical protein
MLLFVYEKTGFKLRWQLAVGILLLYQYLQLAYHYKFFGEMPTVLIGLEYGSLPIKKNGLFCAVTVGKFL